MEREACGAKQVRKYEEKSLNFSSCSYSGLCVVVIRSGGGGESTHLVKTRFRMESIAFVACAAFCAQRKRRELQDKLPTTMAKRKTSARASSESI